MELVASRFGGFPHFLDNSTAARTNYRTTTNHPQDNVFVRFGNVCGSDASQTQRWIEHGVECTKYMLRSAPAVRWRDEIAQQLVGLLSCDQGFVCASLR